MPSFYSKSTESQDQIPIFICRPDDIDSVYKALSKPQVEMAKSLNFSGKANRIVRLPAIGELGEAVLFGAGPKTDDYMGAIRAGHLGGHLREGLYKIELSPSDWDADLMAIGWGLGAYKFDRYLAEPAKCPTLDIGRYKNADELQSLVDATHFGRDLINTPANDMGPQALEDAARKLATAYSATLETTTGQELLNSNFPMIHAVGRAAHEPPRLVEIHWGNDQNPRLAIVGKGITFDTGGVNIKSANSARLMKKDMGGAAHALSLAQMIMANNLPIRLHVLVAIAENAVSAGAYRPGDILQSRIGKTVEIDNTDAEGRLVLGDALTRASEDNPALIMDFATLTGAARVALGPKLPPFFCNTEGLIAPVLKHGLEQIDAVWSMPLWDPYFSMLKSPIATMKNSGGGFAGCITAALFLKQFVENSPWMHFDVYGWNPSSQPGHPSGGEIFALRGLYHWLKAGGLSN